jgi:hypothetical protein
VSGHRITACRCWSDGVWGGAGAYGSVMGKTIADRQMLPGRSGLVDVYRFGVCAVNRPILIDWIEIDAGCFKSRTLTLDRMVTTVYRFIPMPI